MSEFATYAVLFLIAFGAATILPLQSELALVSLLLNGDRPWGIVIFIASLGNILGSVVNWILGRCFVHFQNWRWFPINQKNMKRAESWYHRYGRASLLLSWLPVIGDPLTLAAGVLREPLWSFLILVGTAKTGRYLAISAITLNWM